jgi:TetR/AcrR family transcriptional repressor of nem operon
VLAEPELKKYVHQEISALAERISERLTADKDAGLLPPKFDPQIVAPIIIIYLQGLFRMVLLSYERPQVERQIDVFLTGLEGFKAPVSEQFKG